MQQPIQELLGLRLDEVARSPFALALETKGVAEMIHDRLHLTYSDSGIEFGAHIDGRVASVFLYAEGEKEFSEFAGELPLGLSFTQNRQAVRARLGSPSASGGGARIPLYGFAATWDRFDFEKYSVHVQYFKDERSISQVTVMRSDCVPTERNVK